MRSDSLLRMPVGFASPLWGYFAGAAVTGSAWWWMTRWTRIENLEAMFGSAEARAVKVAALPVPAAEAVVGAAIQALDVMEGVVNQVVEPVLTQAAANVAAEADTLEQALEETPPPILEDVDAPHPVGGESAPVSPVVAAAAPPAPETTAEAEPAEPEAEGEPPIGAARARRRAGSPKSE